MKRYIGASELNLGKLIELILGLSRKTSFPDDVIHVYMDGDDGTYAIDINGELWSNGLSYYEAEKYIYNLFKGIEVAKGLPSRI